MEKDDVLYGLEGWEELEPDLEEAIYRAVDGVVYPGETDFNEVTKEFKWPLKFRVFKRVDISGEEWIKGTADQILCHVMDNLNENYGSPDWDTEFHPTKRMVEAAEAFTRVVSDEYVPWACEPTGEAIEVSQERARKIWEGDEEHNDG